MAISTEKETVPVDQINQAGGHTVDGEGLLNNYAIEPEMYEEDGSSLSDLTNRVTVVDIFSTEEAAKSAALEMEQKGLRSSHISIIAKDYHDPESSMSLETIDAEGGLAVVLKKLGIADSAILKFEEAIKDGQFLLIEIGSDREASQVQHVLENAGHSVQDS